MYEVTGLYILLVISNGLRESNACMSAKPNPPSNTVNCISSLHAYSYIQQSGRIVKTINAKTTKK